MTRIVRLAFGWVAFFLLTGPLFAQMSHEEIVVRTAYARLAYAVDLYTIYTAVQANPKIDFVALAKEIDRQGLRFNLSDFATGNLADIAHDDYSVLGQYPDGQDIISISPVNATSTEIPAPAVSTYMATAAWAPGPQGRAPYRTVGEMLPLEERESGVAPLRRYCTYTVTATLLGRSRTYRASFLFGDRVAPADVVVAIGGGAMRTLLTRKLYPDILIGTKLGSNPAVRDFLAATQREEQICRAGIGDVCCNPEKLQCGVASSDLGRQP